jgi:hypothetical protein
VSATVLPQLDEFVARAWETVCQQYVLRHDPNVTAVGRWWGQVPTGDGRRTEEREIDVVGVDGDRRPLVLGMCRWTSRPVDFPELHLLDRLAPHIGPLGAHRYLFSRSGFTPALTALAAHDPALTLVTPADIYR